MIVGIPGARVEPVTEEPKLDADLEELALFFKTERVELDRAGAGFAGRGGAGTYGRSPELFTSELVLEDVNVDRVRPSFPSREPFDVFSRSAVTLAAGLASPNANLPLSSSEK